MFKSKFIISSIIFIIFLLITSTIKNKTRIIEKKITSLNSKILSRERDINETQLEFYYLSSPVEIEKRIETLGFINYEPISYSKIFFKFTDLINMENKTSNIKDINEKILKKK